MPTPSPVCIVNDLATDNGINVSPNATVTIKLLDITGVSNWSIECINTDELNTATSVNATLVVNSNTFTATYTQPNTATGSAVQFKSTVNYGVDSNGTLQPTYSTTFAIFVLNPLGTRLFFPNETNESSAQFGVISDLNAIGRANVSSPLASINTPGLVQLAGDIGGVYNNVTVAKIQGNPIQSGILDGVNDGYVLTWNASTVQWEVKPPASVLATGKVYLFANVASDISGYNSMTNSVSGTESDLSVAITSGSGKTLIKAFATAPNDPSITVLEKGIWEFDCFRYVSSNAGITQLIFDGYIRTAGGSETFLFSTTSAHITQTAVQLESVSYYIPADTNINATDRIVIKVYGITTSNSTITTHFVFDGTTNTSHMHTPIVGGAFIVGGDLTGTTANANVAKIQGKSLDSTLASVGAAQDGYLLTWVNGSSDWQAKPNNFTGSATPTGSAGGDLSGTYPNPTVAKLTGTTGVVTGPSTGIAIGTNPASTGALRLANNTGMYIRNGTNAGDIQTVLVDSGNTVYFGDVNNAADTLIQAKSGNSVVIAGTSGLLFQATTSSPVFCQSDLSTNGGTGQALTIHAQNETGTTSTGGSLHLSSGTGTSTAGTLLLQTGGTTQLTIDPSPGAEAITILPASVLFNSATSGPTIKQNDLATNGGTAQALTIQAQNETGTTSIGGNLVLKGGTGTSTNGAVILRSGNTTMISAGPAITNVGAGSGNTNTNIQLAGTTYVGISSNVLALGTTTAATTLSGSLALTTRTQTSISLTIDTTTTDMIVLVDTTSNPVGVILPPPTNGRTIILRDSTGKFPTNNCTILRNSTEKINGTAASKVLSAAFGSWIIVSDGTNWTIS